MRRELIDSVDVVVGFVIGTRKDNCRGDHSRGDNGSRDNYRARRKCFRRRTDGYVPCYL